MKRALLLSLIAFLLSLLVTNVYAIPTHCVAHPHNAATVHWEADGGAPGGWGSTAHNHRDTCSFWALSEAGGFGTDHWIDRQPYEPYAVWDCRAVRVDDDANFDDGHGFINEFPLLGGGPAHIPRYYFSPVNSPPATAQANITTAFAMWSAIASDIAGHVVGLEFMPGYPGEIEIRWLNQTNLGVTSLNPGGLSTVTFAANRTWWYGAAAGTPAGQYHFFTTAIHETGHVVGLDEQNDTDDVMYYQQASGVAGPNFMAIDVDSIHGARDLYMIELEEPETPGGRGVGGIWVPVDKFALLAPYIALTSTILVATAATAIYVKHVKHRKKKQ